jgi:hypothetical protein
MVFKLCFYSWTVNIYGFNFIEDYSKLFGLVFVHID